MKELFFRGLLLGGTSVKVFLKLVIVILLLFLCSCSEKNTEKTPADTVLSNPFNVPEKNEIKQYTIGNYGFGYDTQELEFIYESNDISIPLNFNNSDIPIEVAPMIFINGIAQNYTSDVKFNTSILQVLSLEENQSKKCKYSFTPTVKDVKEKDNIYISSMLQPTFTPSESPYIFGVYHSLLSVVPATIEFKSKPVISDAKVKDSPECTLITEAMKTEYNIENNGCDKFILNEKVKNDRSYYLCKNNTLDLTLYAYGNTGGSRKYRVSFYKNHELIQFNDGYDYIDFDVKNEYLTMSDININNVKTSDFIYAIAVPIETENNYIAPVKTETKFISENEIIFDATETQETLTSQSSFDDTSAIPLLTTNNAVFYKIDSIDGAGLSSIDNSTNTVYYADVEKGQKPISVKEIGDKISAVYMADKSEQNETIFDATICTKIVFYDMQLNKISEYNIESLQNKEIAVPFEFDYNDKILIHLNKDIINRECLYEYNFTTGEDKVLMELNQDLTQYDFCSFLNIALADDYIAFTLTTSDQNNDEINMIGKCNLDGSNPEVKIEQGKCDVNVCNNAALWIDNFSSRSQNSSGKLIIYNDGEYKTITTKTADESWKSKLTNGGKTILSLETKYQNNEDSSTVRIYENNDMLKEFTFDNGITVELENMFCLNNKLTVLYEENDIWKTKIIDY